MSVGAFKELIPVEASTVQPDDDPGIGEKRVVFLKEFDIFKPRLCHDCTDMKILYSDSMYIDSDPFRSCRLMCGVSTSLERRKIFESPKHFAFGQSLERGSGSYVIAHIYGLAIEHQRNRDTYLVHHDAACRLVSSISSTSNHDS